MLDSHGAVSTTMAQQSVLYTTATSTTSSWPCCYFLLCHVVADYWLLRMHRFGKEWEQSIYGRLGDLEVQDMAGAHTYLVQRGIAKPDQILLTGGSYGTSCYDYNASVFIVSTRCN